MLNGWLNSKFSLFEKKESLLGRRERLGQNRHTQKCFFRMNQNPPAILKNFSWCYFLNDASMALLSVSVIPSPVLALGVMSVTTHSAKKDGKSKTLLPPPHHRAQWYRSSHPLPGHFFDFHAFLRKTTYISYGTGKIPKRTSSSEVWWEVLAQTLYILLALVP